jgi:hypothetical protein
VLSESGGVVTLTADAAVIEGSSSGDLVRITQTGSGNALVVEDSANPDSTPFVVNSSGNVGIGISDPTSKVWVANPSGTDPVFIVHNTTNTGNVSGIVNILENNGDSTSSYHFAGLTQNVSFFYLYGNGTSSWTSDKRKKKNIETTRDGYARDLCKLRVVKYNWITQEDGEPKELGLIAQEVEEVFPGLIQDALHEDTDGIKYKTIKGSVLPYMLLKAMQEQQAIIESQQSQIDALTARIEALETTP